MTQVTGKGTNSDPYIITLYRVSGGVLATVKIGAYYRFQNLTGETVFNLMVGGPDKNDSIFSIDNVFGTIAQAGLSTARQATNPEPTEAGSIVNGKEQGAGTKTVEFGSLVVD